MLSILYKKILTYTFPNISISNKLEYLLFFIFVQLEILIILTKTHYLFYLILFVLIYESITDYYSYEINSIGNYILIILGIILSLLNNDYHIFKLIIPFILYLLSFFDLLGSGDAEMFLMLSFYFDYEDNIYILFLTCILSLIYSLINKKDKIPLVPFITLSVLIIYSL